MWNQVYNPLANELLSTLVAAIPVVVLLALIASGKVKAHIAAVIALVAAICHRDLGLHHADRPGVAGLGARPGDRLLSDRLDRAQRHLSLPPLRGEGQRSSSCSARSAASRPTGASSSC